MGSCCQIAAKWTDDQNDKLDKIKLVEKYYGNIKEGITVAKKNVTRLEKNIPSHESYVEAVFRELTKMTEKYNDAKKTLEKATEEVAE